MGKIFKRRHRRPLVVHKGSVRRTPNFYPQFYGDGGPVDMHGSGFGSLREASDALRRGNVFGDGGTVEVRTGFKRDSGGSYETQDVGAMDVMSSGMAALQGAEQITKGGMDLAGIADTSAVQDQIDDAFNEDFDEASDNESLLASFGNAGNLRQDWSAKDVRGMSTGEGVGGIFANAGAGAMAGAAAGSIAPGFGTAVGAAAGFVAGLGAGIGGFLAGNRRAKRQAEHLNSQAEAANRYALNAFDSANQNLAERNWRGNLVNLSAYGGELETGENENTKDMERNIYVPRKVFADGGGIHIDPKNRGKFTEAASRAGMGVQEYARHVLANSGNYDATTVRRANFARNAAKWGRAYGGAVRGNRYGGDGRGLTINGASVGSGGLANTLKGILNGISYSSAKPSTQSYVVSQAIAKKRDPRYANRTGVNFSLSDGFKLTGVNPGTGYSSVMSLLKPNKVFNAGRQLVGAMPYSAENLDIGLPQPAREGYGLLSGEPSVYRSMVGPHYVGQASGETLYAHAPLRLRNGRLVSW